MSMAGLPNGCATLATHADALAREQYLDFARVRRFRQSIVARAAEVARARFRPERASPRCTSRRSAGSCRSARPASRAASRGRFIDFLVDAYPSSVPAPTRSRSWRAAASSADEARAMLVRGLFSKRRRPHYAPLPLAARAGPRPRAWHVARHDAQRDDIGHEPAHARCASTISTGRALLIACDGTRDRAALAQAASLTLARRARDRRPVPRALRARRPARGLTLFTKERR
jgi:hypothetical protein